MARASLRHSTPDHDSTTTEFDNICCLPTVVVHIEVALVCELKQRQVNWVQSQCFWHNSRRAYWWRLINNYLFMALPCRPAAASLLLHMVQVLYPRQWCTSLCVTVVYLVRAVLGRSLTIPFPCWRARNPGQHIWSVPVSRQWLWLRSCWDKTLSISISPRHSGVRWFTTSNGVQTTFG